MTFTVGRPTKLSIKSLFLLAFAGLAMGEFAYAQSARVFDEIRPGVYVSQGLQVELTDNTVGKIANTGFLVGGESVAVIDPGGSPAAAQALMTAVAIHTDLPVSHVIISHVHPDHSFGAFSFDESIILVGHKKLEQAVLQRQEFYLRRFGGVFEENNLPKGALIPDLVVQDIVRIDLGNRVLEIRAHATAHTDHDLSVFDLQTDTLWASDLLFVDRLPSLDGSLPGWIAVMDELAALSPEMVVPGHGSPGLWSVVSQPQRDYLQRLLEEVRHAIASGKGLREVSETKWATITQDWMLWVQQHGTNLTKAFTELEWE